MKARAIVEFPGVKDGEVYPKTIEVGAIIEGDLAETAVKYKQAVKVGDDGEPLQKPSGNSKTRTKDRDGQTGDTSGASATGNTGDAGLKTDPVIEIPADWRMLQSDGLMELSKKISGQDAADAAAATAVIEAELAKRASADTATDNK